jgi:hypothetical protein
MEEGAYLREAARFIAAMIEEPDEGIHPLASSLEGSRAVPVDVSGEQPRLDLRR